MENEGQITAKLLKEEHNSDETSFNIEGFIVELKNAEWDWHLLEDETQRLSGKQSVDRAESYQINLEALYKDDKIMLKNIRNTKNKYIPEKYRLPVIL